MKNIMTVELDPDMFMELMDINKQLNDGIRRLEDAERKKM